MTAPGSTSPFSAKECRQYLKLLKGFRGAIFVNIRAALFHTVSNAENGVISPYRIACIGESPYAPSTLHNSSNSVGSQAMG